MPRDLFAEINTQPGPVGKRDLFSEIKMQKNTSTPTQVGKDSGDGLYEGFVKPTLKDYGRLGLATGETALSFGTGAILWPFSKAYGLMALPFGKDAANIAEQEIQKLGYQPRTKEAQEANELLAKGFDAFLYPAKKAGEITEKVSPRAAYIVQLGTELAEFALTGGIVKRGIKGKGIKLPNEAPGLDSTFAKEGPVMDSEALVPTNVIYAGHEPILKNPKVIEYKQQGRIAAPEGLEPQKVLPSGQGFTLKGEPRGPELEVPPSERLLPPGQGFELKDGIPYPPVVSKTIRLPQILETRSQEAIDASHGIKNQPRDLFKEAKESKVVTLRGRIKEMGGINFLNFKGELKELPTSVKFLSKKTGNKIDLAEQELKAEGWLKHDESLLELFRTDPNALKRGKIASEMGIGETGKKTAFQIAEEKKLNVEYESEEPPAGTYNTVNADKLKDGETYTIIEGRTRDGWDEYKVKKTPEGVTLEDGQTIKLDPWDQVEVLKKTSTTGKLKFINETPGAIEVKTPATLSLRQDTYGKQRPTPIGKLVEGKQEKLGLVVEDKRQPGLFMNERGSSPELGHAIKLINEAAKGVSKEVRETVKETTRTIDEYIGAISTRLGNIDPSLKYGLRKFEFNRGVKIANSTERVLPFLKKIDKMIPEDKQSFDIARKNGDPVVIQRMLRKYQLENEYTEVRRMLDEYYKDAQDVDIDVGYRQHFHPRIVKDAKGFLEYFQNGEDWPLLDKAIREKEVKLGRYLEQDEKAAVINSMIRGFSQGKISLSVPGQLKARSVEVVTPELNKFYMSSDSALLRYISSVTDAIEARKAFGKGGKRVSIDDYSPTDTIGHYILELLDQGKIKPEQEHILRDIYGARFNEIGTRGVFGLYKNLSYIDTMGSPISAITQIGDISWALYKNGIGKTISSAARSIVGKSIVKKEMIGIERIAQEFADTSKASMAVTKIFKLIGLEKIDNIGKESLINSTITKSQQLAQTESGRTKLIKELKPIFGTETAQLITDYRNKRITENVKLHTFNVLSDFQPISLSEMPQKYLTGGNGRIFYMLKTFTIKQFDVYRREILQKIKEPGERVQGIKNLVRLTACFVAANASADVIKDLILGRPINVDDKVVDNMLRLLGISKFITWKAREEGAGSAIVRQIAPPFKALDAITKDINRSGDEKGLETPASIPIVGKLYYWWFGKGKTKSDRQFGETADTGKLKGLKTGKLKTLKGL